MGIKEDIISINLEDLHWEQAKIKKIIKQLKDYSTIREKLEVSLIHIQNAFKNSEKIDKLELENAKKDIAELKTSPDLGLIIEIDSKKGFVKAFIGLFKSSTIKKAAAVTALGAAVAVSNPVIADAKPKNTNVQAQVTNEKISDVKQYVADANKCLETNQISKARGMYFNVLNNLPSLIPESRKQKIIEEKVHIYIMQSYVTANDIPNAVKYLEIATKKMPNSNDLRYFSNYYKKKK